MSRITGTDAYGLMEAYNNVYAPQELTEEQVWEEVENWVNSLLEEGYDLSEYTWEEMYEAYIEEAGMDVFSTPAVKKAQASQALSVIKPKPGMDVLRTPAVQNAQKDREVRAAQDLFGIRQKTAATTPAPKPTDIPPARNPQPKGDVIVKAAKGGVPGSLNKTTGKWTSSASSTPAARTPAGTPPGGKVSPTKPAAPAKPATGMLGKTSFERRTPTSAELKAAQAARASGASPEKALQAAKSAGGALQQTAAKVMEKPPAFSPTPAAAKTTPTPVTPKAPTLGSKKPGSMVSHFDPFDVIKGHLLDEGYADTEEAALKIMANMSEEWRQSIVEGEENKEDSQKPFTGEGPKKPKGWRPTGPKLKTGQRPGYAR